MTFSRARPQGWTDQITTINQLELDRIDTNAANALDGHAGGTYAPSGPLALEGSAGFSVGASNPATIAGPLTLAGATTLTGRLTMSGSDAGLGLRVHVATDASETIQGGRVDVVSIPAQLTDDRFYTLAFDDPAPATGHLVRVVRSSRDMVTVAPSAHLAYVRWSLIPLRMVTFQAGRHAYFEAVWTGSAWRPIAWSQADLALVPEAGDSWA